MSEKLTKRQLQAQKTRNRVYNTAVRLMQTKGFDNITVEEICAKAGVSIGSFYNRFKSKYDVLSAIFSEADEYFQNVVVDQLQKVNTAREKILLFFEQYGSYNTSCGVDFVKHFYHVQNKIFITKGRQMQNILQQIITQGQENGEIRQDLPAQEIVQYLFIAARGVVFDWCQHDGKYNLSEYIVSYMELMLKGILTEGEKVQKGV
ncbi:MAG: TetR/AcrR family transcriptional regulator [Firmicutes bacterium]|nr:TetR/AcrR family transcriptional regulator [Bacillota bacterium]